MQVELSKDEIEACVEGLGRLLKKVQHDDPGGNQIVKHHMWEMQGWLTSLKCKLSSLLPLPPGRA